MPKSTVQSPTLPMADAYIYNWPSIGKVQRANINTAYGALLLYILCTVQCGSDHRDEATEVLLFPALRFPAPYTVSSLWTSKDVSMLRAASWSYKSKARNAITACTGL